MPISAFDAANRILGHGEPENAVWFVGLEYAGGYTSAAEAVEYYSRHGEITRPSGRPDFGSRPQGRSIRLLTSRILRLLSTEGAAHDHEWFLQKRLWRPGSDTFQANLFPLGRARHSGSFSATDKEILGSDDWDEYENLVVTDRFPLLRRYWYASARKAAVCFGGEWPWFRALFEVTSEPVDVIPGKVVAHVPERVVLTPFLTFEYGIFTYDDADKVGAFLRDRWEVRIP